ncbi:hypothetical protein C2E23DRAFT_841093 [Lenzites betulinus]|nr:hypothetical protein C2E23DRAFT_841093 [Lenzites betulinus]
MAPSALTPRRAKPWQAPDPSWSSETSRVSPFRCASEEAQQPVCRRTASASPSRC